MGKISELVKKVAVGGIISMVVGCAHINEGIVERKVFIPERYEKMDVPYFIPLGPYSCMVGIIRIQYKVPPQHLLYLQFVDDNEREHVKVVKVPKQIYGMVNYGDWVVETNSKKEFEKIKKELH